MASEFLKKYLLGQQDDENQPLQSPMSETYSMDGKLEMPTTVVQGQPSVKDYLLKKYEQDFGPDVYKKAQEESEKGTMNWGTALGMLMAGVGAGMQGRSGFADAQAVLNMRKEYQKRKHLEPIEKKRKNFLEKLSLGIQLDEDERKQLDWDKKQEDQFRADMLRAQEDDPNSKQSELARNLAKKMVPSFKSEGMSASQINSLMPTMEATYRAEQQKLAKEESRMWQKQMYEDRKLTAEQAREDKEEQKMNERQEKDLQKLSKDVAGVSELNNAMDNVERKLGFKLSQATIHNGDLYVDGEPKDLPGVSIPFIGRVAAPFGEEARTLQSAVAKVFNTELKDRSGAAVTNQELERLKTEFGQGKFNTESELIQALKDYKRMIYDEMKSREAGFRPEIIKEFKRRDGKTSEDYSDVAKGGRRWREVK